ncbi:enoyl-CoA hydratase/carnithine racemase [Xylogone sp. PMI_703]|nr:enoyl-CoA hydratase/carnithine racemase [Xylogone sp. PMI_703]
MTPVNPPLKITKVLPEYWRATFSSPPLNLFSPEIYAALRVLLDDLEKDEAVQVIVFDSDVPNYFCAHFDLARANDVLDIPGSAPFLETWPLFVQRLSTMDVVSIVSIRGRARGVGSEFSLACDMRFASLENAIFGQPEVGAGIAPGGGSPEWLLGLAGRSRTLEIVLGCDDFDAAMAERYGWINRAIPDAQLDQFVDNLARRIAGFNKFPVSAVKRLVNERARITISADIYNSLRVFGECFARPETKRRLEDLFAAGLQQDGEVERNMGAELARIQSK